ncbi:MAG: DUF4012 domain-containing protein [Nitrososphaerota archaeon]
MRDFTGRMPLVGRVTGYRGRQRRIDEGWRRAEYDAGLNGNPDNHLGRLDDELGGPDAGEPLLDAPGLLPPDASGSPPDDFDVAGEYPYSARSHDKRRGGQDSLAKSARRISLKVVLVLALVSVIVGFFCTQSSLTVVDAAAAALDAKAQVTAIEGILHNGNLVNVDHLTEMQTRLVALNGDLLRIQGALPGPVVNTTAGQSLNHTLNMANDLVQAGRYGVDAALILVPHLKGALSDVGGSASASATTTVSKTPGATAPPTATPPTGTANTASGGITMEDVTRAQQDITMAGILAQRALAERQYVNDQQLSRIGLGSVVTILHKMDGLAPKLPTYLGYADSVLQALPDLLGVTKPAHFLLFDIDSDEMRPTGGFMGNYALITVQNGRLIGGVQLKDTFTFDCPGGMNRCIAQGPPIPPQYAWMNAFPDSFRMRDANISPDFPTSAKLIMQKYQQESGQSVDGVIMITPEIIKDILKVTGPIQITGFDPAVEEVNANNLQDVIHYYHILNRNNFSTVGGSSAKKAIDAVLGKTLLHRVGTLSAAKQGELMKSILAGFGTKDVQVYFNDTRLESLLETLHMSSSIPMPPGQDALMVTDTDTGATYYSRDILESVTDTITFDNQGNAIHDMTLAYKLPLVQHLYTKIYVDNYGNALSWYTEVMRTFVPEGSQAIDGSYISDGTMSAVQIDQCNISANQPGIPPCYVFPAPEPGYVIWAARINNMQVGTDNVTFHMKWMTPKVMKTVDGKLQYNLQIYRQAGTHIAYNIRIIPPPGQTIVPPLVSPLKTPNGMTAGTAAEFTSPSLIKDTLLTVTFTGGK